MLNINNSFEFNSKLLLIILFLYGVALGTEQLLELLT